MKWTHLVFGIYTGLVAVLMLVASVLTILEDKKLTDYTVYPNDVLGEIAADWQTVPFTDLTVTTESTCPVGEQEVFTSLWYGMNAACDCLNSGCPCHYDDGLDQEKVCMEGCYTFNLDVSCNNEQGKNGCYDVIAFPAVRQGQFNGLRVCGKLGGEPFLNVTRPDFSTGKCPDGTSPCQETTLPSDTVCYPPGDLAAKCPITDLRVVDSTAESSFTDLGYTTVSYNATTSLVFTKNVRQLPPTTRKVEYEPCMSPSQTSGAPGQQFYLAEMNKSGCTTDSSTELVYDPRYQATGLFSNVYQVQSENGIHSMISDSPDYAKYVSPSIDYNEWQVRSWSRPTINWSLECEASGKTRADAYEVTQNQILNLDVGDSFRNLGIAGCVCYGVVILLMGNEIRDACKGNNETTTAEATLMLGYIPARLCFLVMGPMTLVYLYQCKAIQEGNAITIRNMAMIEGCTDQYTKFDSTGVQAQYDQQQEHLNFLLWCAWLPMGFVIFDVTAGAIGLIVHKLRH